MCTEVPFGYYLLPFTADGCAQSQNEVGIVYFQREVEEREGSGCITSHPQL